MGNSVVLAPVKQAAPQGLGLQDTPKLHSQAPDITQGRHRSFMVSVAVAMFVSHLPFLAIFIIYMVKRSNPNAFLFSFFQGVPERYFVYAIICTVLLLLVILVPTVLPQAGRNGLGYPLYGLYLICLLYLTFFSFMRQSQGIYRYNWDTIMLPIAMAFLYASFGAVITASLSVRKVPRVIAISVGAVGTFMSLLLLYLVSETTLQQFWQLGLYILLGAALGLYYAFDLEDMVLKRGTYYRTNDWFLGFIHLQTDLFFRLPRDLLFRRRNPEEVVQELEIAEPDADLK